jgi:serine/threonine-protein kinase
MFDRTRNEDDLTSLEPSSEPLRIRHNPGTAPRPNPKNDLAAREAAPLENELLQDRYRLVRYIARGGMGTVYEAHDVVDDRRCAIKILHSAFVSSPAAIRRFLRESAVMRSLESDHVVPLIDSGTHAGLPYFVMTLLEGCDLGHVLQRRGRLSARRTVRLGLDICRGLRAIHGAGFIHRDLKPANIFITRSRAGHPTTKILDFGVAKLRGAVGGTEEGTLIGTVAYMAPEQILSSRDVDERADIYSLGAVLYEALSGRKLHQGSRVHVLYSILREDPVPLQRLCPELPQQLSDVVMRALARSASERHANVDELAAGLEPFTTAS